MCDPGEKLSATMKREFMEEALNSNNLSNDQLEEYKMKLANLFKNGNEVNQLNYYLKNKGNTIFNFFLYNYFLDLSWLR